MPHLCVSFALLEEENHRIPCLCMKGTVTESFGTCVFLASTHLVCFSSEMVLQHLNESNSSPEDKISVTHISFLCLSLSLTLSRRHTSTHTCTNVHIQTQNKCAALFLSVLMSLGIIKSLPQILLRVEEQGDVECNDRWQAVIPLLVTVYICVCIYVYIFVYVKDAPVVHSLILQITLQIMFLIDAPLLMFQSHSVKQQMWSVCFIQTVFASLFLWEKKNPQILYFIGFSEYKLNSTRVRSDISIYTLALVLKWAIL